MNFSIVIWLFISWLSVYNCLASNYVRILFSRLLQFRTLYVIFVLRINNTLQIMECKKDNCLVITLVANRLIFLRHIVRTAPVVQPPTRQCGRMGNNSQ